MFSPLISPQAVGADPANVASRKGPESVLRRLTTLPKLAGVTPASRLEVRPAPEMVSSGIPEMDAFIGGLPRGCLTEICGPASSGRTSVLVAALAASTQRDEVCALVDATDVFDPLSAAGVNFERLLWVRCCDAGHSRSLAKRSASGPEAFLSPSRTVEGFGIPRSARNDNYREVEQALRATDLLLQSGGFGLVAIDLGDVPPQTVRRIPSTTWFRFQRAVENTATVLLVIGQTPCAQTCATLLVRLRSAAKRLPAISSQFSEKNGTLPAHARLFDGLQIEGELLRSRMQCKPALSVITAFTSKAAWAG